MQYLDPHHKRTDFVAESFSCEADGEGRSLAFAGQGAHASVVLRQKGMAITAIVPEADCEFVLWKVQIFPKVNWLTLDLEKNALLSRILVHIDRLNADDVDAALTSLIGTRPLPFYKIP